MHKGKCYTARLRMHPFFSRREVLEVWKSNQGIKATYMFLLEKFVVADYSVPAIKLCEILQKKGLFHSRLAFPNWVNYHLQYIQTPLYKFCSSQ